MCNVIATPRRFYLALREGSHEASEADVKKGIHARVTEAVHSLSEPERIQGNVLFEENSSRNLYDLPIVTHFEKDAGPFITSSIVFSENQENGKQNQSTHRLRALITATWPYAWWRADISISPSHTRENMART